MTTTLAASLPAIEPRVVKAATLRDGLARLAATAVADELARRHNVLPIWYEGPPNTFAAPDMIEVSIVIPHCGYAISLTARDHVAYGTIEAMREAAARSLIQLFAVELDEAEARDADRRKAQERMIAANESPHRRFADMIHDTRELADAPIAPPAMLEAAPRRVAQRSLGF